MLDSKGPVIHSTTLSFMAGLHGQVPGGLLRFDLQAILTATIDPSYLQTATAKGIIQTKVRKQKLFIGRLKSVL